VSKFWRPIDWIAEWVQNGVDVEIQQRLAVLVILISVPLMCWGPFSGEQLLIYEMSAVALTLTGITWLGSLVAAKKADEAKDANSPSEPPPPVP
jgi:hypothetical protein